MKKPWVILLAVAVVVFYAYDGLQQKDRENKLECDVCQEAMYESQLAYTMSDERLCGGCLQDSDYDRCVECGGFYEDEYEGGDGYCGGCAEKLCWVCAFCEENAQSLEDLVEVESGYFLCASCAFEYAGGLSKNGLAFFEKYHASAKHPRM